MIVTVIEVLLLLFCLGVYLGGVGGCVSMHTCEIQNTCGRWFSRLYSLA